MLCSVWICIIKNNNKIILHFKVSLASTSIPTDVKEDLQKPSMDIWELASQVDKDIPEDIWDIVGMFLLIRLLFR